MTVLRTPTEALALISGGLDDTSVGAFVGEPVLAIDLDGLDDIAGLEQLTRLLAQSPVVIIGISAEPVDGGSSLDPIDVLLCDRPGAPSPWVSCPEGTGPALERLAAAVARSPGAATSLIQLLRVGSTMSAADAVVAESMVYSLLQGGPDHRRWLEARRDHERRARPESPVVEVSRRGSTLLVRLDRPEVRNAYGTRMRDELVDAVGLARIDPTIDVVELRGAGPVFCSGGDLDEFGTAADPLAAHMIRTTRNAGIALTRIADRVIAYVHGRCVGAGVELPAFARRAVAHSDATFLLPEISMGLVPGAGGTSSIPRRIGRQRAAWMALNGEPIDASTALAWGLVDVIDDDAFTGSDLT